MPSVSAVNSRGGRMVTGRHSLILASASPRRHELVRQLDVCATVEVCPLEEPVSKPPDVSPRAWAEALAFFKAAAVAGTHADAVVLGADTIVACEGELLGKPADRVDAQRMLELQAGRDTYVITGVCLLRWGESPIRLIQHDATVVRMRDDAAERAAYLETGDWAGKAGAYGIQNVGDRLVERCEGSFSNVVGLPLELLARMLVRVFG